MATLLSILLLLFAGYPCGARGVCQGVSPTGQRWIYVQPQHTGTATVVPYLRKVLGLGATCEHGHAMTPPNGSHQSATFAFGFVANPFRRVLSHAAFEGIINGQRHHNHTRAQDVRAFRQYVKSEVDYHGHPHDMHVWSQSAMFAEFPMRFIGCTAKLASHLQVVLALLGYDDHSVSFEHSHCAAGCAAPTAPATRQQHSQGHGGQSTHIEPDVADSLWYDAEAERRVRLWFRDDLCNFGFNVSSTAMFDAGGCEAWTTAPGAGAGLVRRSCGQLGAAR